MMQRTEKTGDIVWKCGGVSSSVPFSIRNPKFATRHFQASRLRRGFTLIELLVVIAIISLLISILLPSLQQGKRLAQSAVCMSTLRNLSLAFMLYAQENDEYVVPGKMPVGNLAYGRIWRNLLFPYTEGTRDAYRCPSDEQFCPTDPVWGPIYGWNAPNNGFNSTISYGYNVWNVGRFRNENSPLPGWCHLYHRLGEFGSPSQTFVFADSFGRSVWYREHASWKYQPQIIAKWTYLIDPIHTGRANMVFLDGAVNSQESPLEFKAEFCAGDVEGLR